MEELQINKKRRFVQASLPVVLLGLEKSYLYKFKSFYK